MNRRQWIKTGLVGGVALGTAAVLAPRLVPGLKPDPMRPAPPGLPV